MLEIKVLIVEFLVGPDATAAPAVARGEIASLYHKVLDLIEAWTCVAWVVKFSCVTATDARESCFEDVGHELGIRRS